MVSTAFISQIKGQTSAVAVMWGMLQIALWNILPNKKPASSYGVVPSNKQSLTYYTEDLKVLMGYLAEGKIRPVIARRMPLVEARQAQELLLGFKVRGKIVLICNEY